MTSFSKNKIARTFILILFFGMVQFCFSGSIANLTSPSTPIAYAADPAAAPAADPAKPIKEGDNNAQGAGTTQPPKEAGSVWSTIAQYIGTVILSLASGITWLGGKTLEIAIEKLVLGMGDFVNNGIGFAINTTWMTIRDLCNLAFIFGFIYIGIRTIIDSDSSSAKKTLSSIIIGAVLINFSLFITKLVIDFSNFLAVKIYFQMLQGSNETNLSHAIMSTLGIVSLFESPDNSVFANMTGAGNFTFYVLGAVFLIIAGFVLGAGGILLILRFIKLIFIMMFSPILFVANIFPTTKQYADKLWSELISNAFFAPVYLLLIFISLKILQGSMNFLNPHKTNMANALSPDGHGVDTYAVVLNFLIATFLLMQSLKIAQAFGIAGANKVIGTTKGLIGGATIGMAAYAGRATLGRFAHKTSEDTNLQERAATSWGAKQKLKLARRIADSSFDGRNTAAGKGLDVGEGRKGGYATALKETKEKEEKFGKSLGQVDDTDVRVQARKKEWEAAQRTQSAESAHLRKRLETAATPADRAHIQGEIDALEKKTKDAQITYEKEKQRRILGSTFAEPSHVMDQAKKIDLERDIQRKKDDLDTLWKGGTLHDQNHTVVANAYSDPTMTDLNKKLRRHQIEQHKKMLEELETNLSKHLTETVDDRGYAGVLEKSKLWNSWLKGRSVREQHEAGKAMRKAAEKGLPKQKDN